MSLLLLLRGHGSVGAPPPSGVFLDSVSVEMALGGSYYEAVTFNPSLPAGPTGFWLLNEFFSTSAARDRSGWNRDGTYTNFTAGDLGLMGPFPHGGTSAWFDGNNSITMGDVADYAFTDEFSVACLFATNGFAPTVMGLVTKGLTNGAGWGLWMNGNGTIKFEAYTAAPAVVFDVNTPGGYDDGQWHHVVATWTGDTTANGVKVYVDGALAVQTTAVAGTPATNTSPFYIGAIDNGGTPSNFFSGQMAGVAVFSWPGSALVSAADALAHYNATRWTDVTEDVLTGPGLSSEYGTLGVHPLDRLAHTGTLMCAMNNSYTNSTGFPGAYAPRNGNCRAGFTYGTPIRVRLTHAGVPRIRFWGRIQSIDPMPGLKRSRQTLITAHDYIHTLVNADFREVVPQIGQTDINLILTAIESLSPLAQPMAVQYQPFADLYSYAFHDLQGGVKVATAIHRVLVSGWSRAYVKGNGTFCWLNRNHISPDPIYILDDDDLMGVSVPSDAKHAFERVRTVIHPNAIDPAPTVIFAHASASTNGGAQFVAAAGGREVIWGTYFNPVIETMAIGGFDFVDPPVSGTDFVANSADDGTGSDLTSNVTVTADFFASTVKLTIMNNHPTLGAYFTTLQVRGRGIYDLSPITTDSLTTLGSGLNPLTIDMPYQQGAEIGAQLAEIIITKEHGILDPVEEVTISPHRSAVLMSLALDGEPGDRIQVTETVTGILNAAATIRSVRLELQAGNLLTATIGLLPGNGV